ncbi:MAG: TrkA family potassium uptake protein [Halanaeroarchaeum sp.]
MDTWKRRTLAYSLSLAAVMLVFAAVYHVGMVTAEGESVTFLHSLQIVVETFTTTGFGSDAPWTSPAMNVLVIVMQLAGVALIFLAFPVLVFPLLEDVFSTTVPTTVSEDLADHVVICTYSPRVSALVDELSARDVPFVIVEPDRDRAVDLYEDGFRVIRGAPDSIETLERANLVDARALVADVSDEMDASIVLTAREIDEDVTVVSVVEDPERTTYHDLAGADAVLSPRPLLGTSLASTVATSATAIPGDDVEIGDAFEIAEVPIHRGSPLVGTTIANSGIRERAGVNVVGAWFRGDFETPPSPNATITNGTVLLVAGRDDQLERLREMTRSSVRRTGTGETIVVGYGQVGRAVVEELDAMDLPHTVVDRESGPGVDVVGDATDPEAFREAGLAAARSVILAIPDDTTTEFATLVIREESPETEVVARVDETRNLQKMYRAGADYVLSLGTVTGRMVASAVLESEEVLSFENQVEIVRTRAPGLAGRTMEDAAVRSRTNCTVLGVERDDDLLTDLGPDFRFEDGDALVIAGPDASVRRFNDLFG